MLWKLTLPRKSQLSKGFARFREKMSRTVVIHLDTASERLPIIDKLKKTLIHQLEVYSAKDGTEWEKNPKIKKDHPWSNDTITRGMLGCTHSHVDILYTSLKAKEQAVLLFEDDCNMTKSQDDVYRFIHMANQLPERWDILLLGANEYVETEPINQSYVRVKRFWGTHAIIIKEHAMRGALKAFAAAQAKGHFLPPDWMYNNAIKDENVVCIGPSLPNYLCEQKVGLVSAINGKVRGGKV